VVGVCSTALSQRPEARSFYEVEALKPGWSVRQLDRQIGSQFHERVALSQNKAVMLEGVASSDAQDLMTPEEAIKDPLVLAFLDLKDEYSESEEDVAPAKTLGRIRVGLD
jgi:predicted nuclease of restriction endonuclease-like (RecB) superfamily